MSDYPRIWDRNGERKIIGETRVSWLVHPETTWGEPIKVKKKNPNNNPDWPQWFFDEESREMFAWWVRHRHSVPRAVERLDAATLRKVADLIGYKEEAK